MMKLPLIEKCNVQINTFRIDTSLLIISEGFEERSLSWIKSLANDKYFKRSIIFKNIPVRKSRLEELESEVIIRSKIKPVITEFDRNKIEQTELQIKSLLCTELIGMTDIYIDISVMSRILIIMLICITSAYNINIHIIYTEPEEYAPTMEAFHEHLKNQQVASIAPSSGVRQVIRTAMLSSSIMQDSPTIVIGFTSFNEQLLRALLSSLNPAHLFIINLIPPTLKWRALATLLVHKDIVHEYQNDNPVSDTDSLLIRRSSSLYYQQTIDVISDIYKTYCYNHRIVIAPTGSKMQSLACGLIKCLCPDIHFEYPTPDSYFVDNYSSSSIRDIHYIRFENINEFIMQYSEVTGLNG